MKNLKKSVSLLAALAMAGTLLAGCAGGTTAQNASSGASSAQKVSILLADNGVTVDGAGASGDSSSAVYVGAPIIYYKDGTDESYGAGSQADMHTAEDAAKHTVVTITQPGTYEVSGSLSYGQIAVDLGENAKEDPNAVVTLILNDASVNCTVVPAIIVYRAYECGDDTAENATNAVDTAGAGFHLQLADGTTNQINGSYVAKIYQEGTTDKLYKYDAAIESTVSMTIEGNGVLNVEAENEGIETALHLTINGGVLNINSGDDAINASEDGVSVLTINEGTITCNAGGGDEGDGIDSNGWIVINGGVITATANPQSQDSGVDSDLGIVLNGGTLLSGGNMYDEISADSTQQYLVLSFATTQKKDTITMLCDADGKPVMAFRAANDGSVFVYSSDLLTEGDYTLYTVSSVTGTQNGNLWTDITDYTDAEQLGYTGTGADGMRGGMRPDDGTMPPDGQSAPDMPQDGAPSNEGKTPMELPADAQKGERGMRPGADTVAGATPADSAVDSVAGATVSEKGMQRPDDTAQSGEQQTIFTLSASAHRFSGIAPVTSA